MKPDQHKPNLGNERSLALEGIDASSLESILLPNFFVFKSRLSTNKVFLTQNAHLTTGIFDQDFSWNKLLNIVHPHHRNRLDITIQFLLDRIKNDTEFKKLCQTNSIVLFFSIRDKSHDYWLTIRQEILLKTDNHGQYLLNICVIDNAIHHDSIQKYISVTQLTKNRNRNKMLTLKWQKLLQSRLLNNLIEQLSNAELDVIRIYTESIELPSQQEVCKILGIKKNTLKKRVQRLMKKLNNIGYLVNNMEEITFHLHR